jgi:hypothetical protein
MHGGQRAWRLPYFVKSIIPLNGQQTTRRRARYSRAAVVITCVAYYWSCMHVCVCVCSFKTFCRACTHSWFLVGLCIPCIHRTLSNSYLQSSALAANHVSCCVSVLTAACTGVPPVVEHAIFSCANKVTGNTCPGTCEDTFQQQGSLVTTCLANGTFSAVDGSCVATARE